MPLPSIRPPSTFRTAGALGLFAVLMVAPVAHASPVVTYVVPDSDFVPLALPNVEPGTTATRTGSLDGSNPASPHLADVYSFTVSQPGSYVFDIDTEGIDPDRRADLFLTLWVDWTVPFCAGCTIESHGLFPVAWADDGGFDVGSDSSFPDPYLGVIGLEPVAHLGSYFDGVIDDYVDAAWPLTYHIMVSPALVFPNALFSLVGDLNDLTRPDGGAGGFVGASVGGVSGDNPINARSILPSTYPASTFTDLYAPYIGQPGTGGDYTLYITRLEDPDSSIPTPEPGTLTLMLGGLAAATYRARPQRRRR